MVQSKPLNFTVCFTAKTKMGRSCEWCLSLAHDSSERSRMEGEMDVALRLRVVEVVVGATPPLPSGRLAPLGYEQTDVCKFYIKGRCHY